VGWGNPGVSIVSQGPVAMGLTLFAVDPVALGNTTNRGVLGGANRTKIASYPFGMAGNPRMSHGGIIAYQVWDWAHQGTKIDTSSDKVVWSDWGGGGDWIDGTNRQGVVQPYTLSAGTMDSTISSTTAYNVFTVASIGDALVGDTIFFQTDWTACNATDYPYVTAFITNITSTTITTDSPACADHSSGSMPGTNRPLVTGWAHEGSQYNGGGSWATRNYAVLMIYDPADLKLVAQGLKSPSTVNPAHIYQLPLAGLTQPYNAQSHGHNGSNMAAAYSPVTKRLYIWAHGLYERAQNDVPALVHVFQVGA
jgi:hypothetical protein